MGGMRHQHIITFLIFLFACAPASGRQVGSWKDVKNLDPGVLISVKTHRLVPAMTCYFQWATDDRLACADAHRVPFGPQTFVFNRRSVHRVRFEHTDAYNARVGGTIGLGIGATIGAVACRGPECQNGARQLSAVLLGAIGGLSGDLIGQMFPILHGPVVYSR